MHKIAIGLAAVFAVMVLIAVSLNTFKTARENMSDETTRYSSPINTTSNTNNSNTNQASPWPKTFTNTEYEYSFKYPEEISVSCNEPGIAIEEAPKVCLYLWKTGEGPGDAPTMYVDVRDEDLFSNKFESTLELGLSDYANKIWQLNKDEEDNDKDVSKLEKIKIGGRTAYQFSTTDSLRTDTKTSRVGERTTVILVDTKDRVKLLITYPKGEDIFEDLLDTFAFL